MDESEEEVMFESADESAEQGNSTTLKKCEKRKVDQVGEGSLDAVTNVASISTGDSSCNNKSPVLSESNEEAELKSTLEKLADNVKESSGWGWSTLSSWGSSVLNTAASSVSTFTSHVGDGFHQVLESVESTLVEPEGNEEIASADGSSTTESEHTEQANDLPSEADSTETKLVEKAANSSDQEKTETVDESGNRGWFVGWSTSLSEVVNKTSSVVQQTVEQTTNVSKKVVSSSLDVLETIGKKTYNVLAEGDHGLKKTIEKTRQNKPNLSQILREAKEEAEEKAKEEEEFLESRKYHYGAQFDDFQGLVQLEALEMLSCMSEGKVRGLLDVLPKEASELLKADLTSIKLSFEESGLENDDDDSLDHDFHQLLMDYVSRLSLNVSIQKLLQCQAAARQWLITYEKQLADDPEVERNPKDIHQRAIQSLAEITAYSIEHFHRVGQLILQDKTIPLTLYPMMAKCLSNLTKVLCQEISWQSSLFVNCLTTSASGSDMPVSEIITNVYLEASNSSTYLQDGFQLLLPIIQLASIEAHPTCQSLLKT